MKQPKGLKSAHTSNSKIGMGSFYGTGERNPLGKSRDVLGQKSMPKKALSKPPKKLA